MQPIDYMLSRQLYDKFYGIEVADLLEQTNLSRVELDVLLFLFNNPTYTKAKDIVEVRGIAKSYVSKAVDLLAKKEMLSVQTDEKDRRGSHLYLTKRGEEIAGEGRLIQIQIIDEMLEGIPEEDIQCMLEVIQKINHNMKRKIKE